MKKTKTKIIGLGLALLALSPLALGTSAMAWGPDRVTYTNNDPANRATFNSITDNTAVGNEQDFVRIEEKGSGRDYSNEIILEAGKQYEVYIYFHNDASATFNEEEYNFQGVAKDVRLSSSFPSSLSANERAEVTGRITASNTIYPAYWDEAYVTAKQAMTLHYVTGSAKLYIDKEFAMNGATLSTQLFSTEGTLLGSNELNGIIEGCDKYSGQVVYTIQTEATPDSSTKYELPKTGPAEAMLAAIVVLGVGAGGLYWYHMHKAVKKVAKKSRGRKK